MRYSAVDAAGMLVPGELDVTSEADAVAALRQLGLLPVRVEAAGAALGAVRSSDKLNPNRSGY